jgi:hypothetical protein
MPELSKNQKFQLSEMGATFRSRVVRVKLEDGREDVIGSTIVTVEEIDGGRVLAEVKLKGTGGEVEQRAMDEAIEAARAAAKVEVERPSSDPNDALRKQVAAAEAQLAAMRKQIAELAAAKV